ncbi:short-chain dehydrogenase [Microtetraspora sp. NBRC 13810]|uniref:SDR family NAD(P)-dependent oxidoreductase n=1 Tax=Microtetraspora sp. NBRC 13810 TaxID=3030990 RepID=UPI0024A2E370|nr:3-oxoacyl-ACP reductase FabG [Microtetraspora sp. NBRC 13810]GLW06763.1 short-chain dehydrogenase [Microtetraspora sp. NBRC 13810]
MDLGLAGKRVLVTGGTRGIGRETVLAFARAGARVVACSRGGDDAADSLARELKGLGDGHRVVAADVTDATAAAALADTCRETLGGLDVVVNNVGIDARSPFEKLTEQEWHRVVETNLTSCFLVTQAALPLLAEHGSVINIGASAGMRGRPESAHYGASKTALSGFTRSLARELGGRGIRVNVVAPGVIVTEPGGGPPPPVADLIRAVTALGRLGTGADVAAAVLFLAGDVSRYITGVTLNVDGGI